jgi:hypothetical protein
MVRGFGWTVGEEFTKEQIDLLNKYISEVKNPKIFLVELVTDYQFLVVLDEKGTQEIADRMFRNYFIGTDPESKETIFEVLGTETGQIRFLKMKGNYAEFDGQHVRCLCGEAEWETATDVEKLLYRDGFGDAFEEISCTEKDEIVAQNRTIFVKLTMEA